MKIEGLTLFQKYRMIVRAFAEKREQLDAQEEALVEELFRQQVDSGTLKQELN